MGRATGRGTSISTGEDRLANKGGASLPRPCSPPKRLPPADEVAPRPDPTNVHLNPPSSGRELRTELAPSQPNELPLDPDGSPTRADEDLHHALGAHAQESSR